MREIYRCAEQVLVSLGPSADDSELSYSILRRLAMYFPEIQIESVHSSLALTGRYCSSFPSRRKRRLLMILRRMDGSSFSRKRSSRCLMC